MKFIFSSDSTDQSLLIEINRTHEPDLFKLIDEVSENLGTQKPKKVLLSPEVNAYVSYNSVFWSMILPVKKNLTIGLGLINSTTESELKAILAHEFGHFSQRSMKVGSYVNQANKIVHNTLYRNENFDSMLNSFARMHALITLFAQFSYYIISGIKWTLQKSHDFLYKKHMSLSRQMEFHADAIATTVVGSQINSEALLRLDLSEMSLHNSVNFYRNSKIQFNTKNLFQNQSTLLKYYGKQNKYEIENELPKVKLSDLYKFNHSKLVIEDQWASHPTMQQRVESIMKLNIEGSNIKNDAAKNILHHFDKYAEILTQKYFAANGVIYSDNFITNHEFLQKFETEITDYDFPEIYNSYYDQKNPPLICSENDVLESDISNSTEFFSDENINLVFEKNTLENELKTLSIIKNKDYKIKTFDYDGHRYFIKDVEKVEKICNRRLDVVEKDIQKNDHMFLKFLFENIKNEQKNDLILNLKNYVDNDSNYEKHIAAFNEFVPYIAFMRETMKVELIRKKRYELTKPEENFKNAVKELVSGFTTENTQTENIKKLKKYADSNNKYFEFDKYINYETTMLFEALDAYIMILNYQYFEAKKNLLKFEAKIYEKIKAEKN